MKSSSPKALVVIPTYNERYNIVPLLRELLSLPSPIPLSILVVDDSSPDQTAESVKEEQKRHPSSIYLLLREKKSGIGTAYREGFQFAIAHHFDFIVQMDADFSHDPQDVCRLLETCMEPVYDVVIGSRYVANSRISGFSFVRSFFSRFFCMCARFLLRFPVRDNTGGFVCYSRDVLRRLELDTLRSAGYVFQIEMKYRVWLAQFRLKEIPISFKGRVKGKSKMSLGIFLEAVWVLSKIRFMADAKLIYTWLFGMDSVRN
ncbi:MAG: polyprenol monophosphomannose synthase [Cytophagales bacterium]|nr:polyprenol monophosphomannose synthase [Cytophagales bacterium]